MNDEKPDYVKNELQALKLNVKNLLRRYFECNDNGEPNPEHDPYYTAQDFVDDIHDLIGNI